MTAVVRQLVLAGDAAAPGSASQWVNVLGVAFDLSHDEVFALDLCATELVSNIVSHGEVNSRDRPVELRVKLTSDRIAIEIRDSGRPFDPLAVAPPRPAPSLEEATPGGLGIHLVRTFSDDSRYRRSEGRNVFTFSARRCCHFPVTARLDSRPHVSFLL